MAFGVVPLLFAHLPSAALAGGMAAQLFEMQTWVSAVLGVMLLLASRMERYPAIARRAGAATGFVIGGVLLALLVEFAVAPRIVARENLPLWHGVGSAMYFLQWICATVTFWHMARPGSPDEAPLARSGCAS